MADLRWSEIILVYLATAELRCYLSVDLSIWSDVLIPRLEYRRGTSMATRNRPRQTVVPAGQPRREIPNDRIRNHAQQYREVAEDLFHRPGGPNPNVVPLFTCCSLALELFLKALVAENRYEDLGVRYGSLFQGAYQITARYRGREHKLSRIYEEVPESVREKLEAAFTRQHPMSGAATLREALARYDNLFVQSRYSYEDDELSLSGSVNELVGLVSWLGTQLNEMPREMVFDESEPMPGHPGHVEGDTVVLDPGVSLPDESTVQIEAADGSLPVENGSVEDAIIRLDWSGAFLEGTKVVVRVTGKLLAVEELHPAFRVGDRAVKADNTGPKWNDGPPKVENQ